MPRHAVLEPGLKCVRSARRDHKLRNGIHVRAHRQYLILGASESKTSPIRRLNSRVEMSAAQLSVRLSPCQTAAKTPRQVFTTDIWRFLTSPQSASHLAGVKQKNKIQQNKIIPSSYIYITLSLASPRPPLLSSTLGQQTPTLKISFHHRANSRSYERNHHRHGNHGAGRRR